MEQPEVRVLVLGPLDVAVDGRTVGPAAPMVMPRALFVTLAVSANRVLSKDTLVDRLWAEPPPSARNLVEKYVAQWRRVLGPDRVETVGRGYRLNLDRGECDLLASRDLASRARAAGRTGDTDEARQCLEAAVALWDAGFEDTLQDRLAEVDHRDLVEHYLATLEGWASLTLAAGSPDSRLDDALRRAVDRHPLRERLTELLMWTRWLQGRQQEALARFDLTRRVLADEVGQDPGPGLASMQQRILRHDPALDRRVVRPRPVDNLPGRNGRFVGRAEELRTLGHLLDPTCFPARLVSLWGLVGSGKSALAAEWAHRQGDRYDQVWWVDASTHASTAHGLEELARRLGCDLRAEREEDLHRVWDELARRDTSLVVFDNAAPAAALAAYLPPAGVADVIVTSLDPHWTPAAETLHVDVLPEADGVSMLRAALGPGRPTSERSLVAALGRLPLALTQASAYIGETGMATEQYLDLFRRRRSALLERGLPDDHQRTIETTWLLARGQLQDDPAALELLGLCSVLGPDRIPLDLLRAAPGLLGPHLGPAVVSEVGLEDAIGRARRYSLLDRDGDTVSMHCLVQGVIAASLTGEARRARHCEGVAVCVAVAPYAVDSPVDWPRWEVLLPHITALALPDPGGAPVLAPPPGFADLLQRSSHYLSRRGSLGQSLALLRQAQREGARAGAVGPVGLGPTTVGNLSGRR